MGTVESQRVSLNFGFLHAVSPAMEATAAQAERLLHVDAAACVVKVRVLGEMLSHAALGALGVSTAGMKFADCIGELSRRGALTPDVRAMFHAVRDTGNRAAHENTATPTGAQHLLHLAWRLALWCRRTVEPGTFKQPAWNDIPDPSAAQRAMAEAMSRLQRELDEQRRAHEAARTEALSLAEQSERWKRELEAALHTAAKAAEERAGGETLADEASTKLSAALAAQASQNTVTDAVLARAQEAGSTEALDLDEADTRVLIDAQLRAAGWEADTEQLTYAKGARPTAGRALAIAEWPTRDGIADYVLFDGLTAVAVIEAKRKRIDVPGAVLAAGDAAPSFRATTHDGHAVESTGGPRPRALVVYFYPRDETPGCTREACAFRDAFRAYTDAGADIVGVSTDTKQAHEGFAQHHQLPFGLIADPQGQLARAFGLDASGGYAPRTTFVIGRSGRVARVFEGVRVDGHADEVLAAVRSAQ